MTAEAKGYEVREGVRLLMSFDPEVAKGIQVMDIERPAELARADIAVLADLVASSASSHSWTPRGAVIGLITTLPMAVLLCGKPALTGFCHASERAAVTAGHMGALDLKSDPADGAFQGHAGNGFAGGRIAEAGMCRPSLVLAEPSPETELRAKATLGSYLSTQRLAALYAYLWSGIAKGVEMIAKVSAINCASTLARAVFSGPRRIILEPLTASRAFRRNLRHHDNRSICVQIGQEIRGHQWLQP